MWFVKGKIIEALRVSNIRCEWLWRRLGCTREELKQILCGAQAANYEIAKGFLEVLGYDLVVSSIDWRNTRYAGA